VNTIPKIDIPKKEKYEWNEESIATDKLMIANIISEFTLKGDFTLSNGGTSDTYIDLRAAILTHPRFIGKYMNYMVGPDSYPVGTGAGGALLLGVMQREGFLWNPKPHGIEWSPQPKEGMKVVLVDDVHTTGNTIKNLREACKKQKLNVIKEIVLYRR